jgi:hypothetical protein
VPWADSYSKITEIIMTLQYSVAVRNARLDAIEATIGTAPLLKLYSGAPPATTATAASGTLIESQALPSDWLANAGSGVKSKSGTWSGTFDAPGMVGYFRITDSAGTAVGMQGTVTATGGGGDMTVDNPVAALGQAYSVTGFDLTAGNP